MRHVLADPNLPHQIQIRRLGNSGVYVTCNCLVRELARQTSARSTRRTSQHKRQGVVSDRASLGDFDVTTPTTDLLARYATHLKDVALPGWDVKEALEQVG